MKKLLLTCAALSLAIPAFAKNDALSLIPNDAVTVGVVRLADMRSSPLSSTLFQKTDEISTNGDAAAFLHDAGLQPTKDIDVLMVATTPRTALGTNADVLIAAEGRFDVDRLTSALVSRGATRVDNYLLLPNNNDQRNGAAAFPDAHLAVVGSVDAVKAALTAYANGGTQFLTASGLARDLGRIDPNATAWAIVDVARARRIAGGPHISTESKQGMMLNNALKTVTTVALWATDSGDALKLGAFGLSSDPQTLQDVEDTLRGALSAMRLAVQDKNPDLVTVLRRFSVSRSDNAVTISGSLPASAVRQYMSHHHAAESR
ncbi:MAG TPA: hypothetical protein VL284_17720 [Thermoanaerobaculia bacterium]|nr:hypothetical protein [Thermoanaerobaculia bacterium]